MSYLPAHVCIEPRGADSDEDRKTAWVLHGILGSGRNWRTFVQRLADTLGDWDFILVDLRNHGESGRAPGPQTLVQCAADLERLSRALGTPVDALVGHSFGGKVALTYAREHGGPSHLWILDAPPGPGAAGLDPDGSREIEHVFAGIASLREPITDRRQVVSALTARGLSRGIAEWMTTNLRPVPGGYGWKFDLEAVREMMASYFEEDLWPLVEDPPYGTRLHLVRGGLSDRWSPEDVRRLEAVAAAGRAEVHTLADAGHWVHVDAPDALAELIVGDLRQA